MVNFKSVIKSKLCRFTPCLFLFLFALSGCMVGPDFHKPPTPCVSKYNAHPLPKKTVSTPSAGNAGISQRYVNKEGIPAAWWHVFHSREIDKLVRAGINHSPTIMAAQAALKEAQETLNAQIGNLLFPAFNANLGAERQLFQGASLGTNSIPSSVFNTFNANVSVSYTFDIFGGSRRQIESLQAQVDYQQFQLLATYLTLTTNIVTTAVTVASLEEQVRVTKELISSAEHQLDIMKKQFEAGGIPESNVLQQQTFVDQTRVKLPPREKLLAQSQHALAVLVGVFPNTPMPHINLNKLKLATTLPVSLPSDLVRQRPDVRAAEAVMHSAMAQIGVATANLLPSFTLSGADGWLAAVPSELFNPNSKLWNISSQIAQPIFHGGALLATRRAAIATYEQTAAQYRQALLLAFQNVADSLRAIDMDARTFNAQHTALQSSSETLRILRAQFQDGGVSFIDVLNAEQTYQQIRLDTIEATAARYTDTAALFQALGGGWWNRSKASCDPINPTGANRECS